MQDDLLEKYAAVLEWGLDAARGRAYKPYEPVLIRFELSALPLAEALARRLLPRKLNVISRLVSPPGMEKDFYMLSDERQRAFLAAGEREFYNSLAGNVFIGAPDSLTHLKDVDPKRIAEAARARKAIREIQEAREAAGKFGWTLAILPTRELARRAGCSPEAYTREITRACFLDEADPVAKWKEVHAEAQEIKRWLTALRAETVRVETKNMDITIEIGKQRRFLGVSGHNIPSFEIFTSPDWRNARGTWYANQPSYRSGNLVEGIRLEFARGRAQLTGARQGEEFTRQMLAMDRGAAQIGEFSLTDRRFSRIRRFMAETLYDENYGGDEGNAHIALGNAYIDTFAGKQSALTKATRGALGFNESALHWDLVNTEAKTVHARLPGGETRLIYEHGSFRL